MQRETDRSAIATITLGRLLIACVALLSLGAGLIHLSVAGQHLSHPFLVAGFIGMGLAQFALAGALVLRGSTGVLAAAAAVNLGIVALWAATRATAMPWVSGLESAQPVGIADVVATLLEVALVAVAGIALLLPSAARDTAVPAAQHVLVGVATAVVLLAVPGLLAPHAHPSHGAGSAQAHAAKGHGHEPVTWEQAHDVLAGHGHGGTAREHDSSSDDRVDHGAMTHTESHPHGGPASSPSDHGHGGAGGIPATEHGHDAMNEPEHGGHSTDGAQARSEREVLRYGENYLAYEPATNDGTHGSAFRWHDARGDGHHSSAAGCRPTAEQQAAADDIARATSASLLKYKNNPWRALRDGFVAYPIPVWKMFHMVSVTRFGDREVLEPDRIESFMYMMTDEGLVAVGGMFIFSDRDAAPPNPTGCLLVWHKHTGYEGLVTSFDPRRPAESVWMAHVWTYGGLDPWGRDFDGTEPYRWFFAYRYVPAVCAQDGECI